jgi:hypothetical protein
MASTALAVTTDDGASSPLPTSSFSAVDEIVGIAVVLVGIEADTWSGPPIATHGTFEHTKNALRKTTRVLAAHGEPPVRGLAADA